MFDYFRLAGADKEQMLKIYASDKAAAERAVKLSNLGRAFLAILIAYSGAFIFTGQYVLDTWAKLFTAPLLLVTISLIMASCYCFETGREERGRHVMMFAVSASCIVSVIFCGGFLESHATPMLIFPMVLGFCILSPRLARWNFFITGLGPLAVDGLVRLLGWQLPNFTSASSDLINEFGLMATLFAAIYFCLAYLRQQNLAGDEKVQS